MNYREAKAPPDRWQDFEDLCLKLWRPRLIDAKKHGRSGQPQAGVDIFGRDPQTEGWVGIQCKQKGVWPPQVLTIRQIENEIREAESFEPPLSHFIVATTARRDVGTQEHVRKLSEQRRDAGHFTVDLFAWDDLQEWLHEGPEPISREKALWVWRQRILRLHSRLMPYFQERSAPLLEHVYVELQLDPERLGRAAGADLEIRSEGRLLGRRLSIRQVLDLDPAEHPWITRRWLLRGDPGSGKTTLLRHLAWTLADAGGNPWVPVFESLPRLMADKQSVFGRIEEDLDRADQPGAAIRELLEEEAKGGRLLLLLDGLDEVPREDRDRAETLLSELAARWPKSPIVATTRPIGAWSPGPEFLELEVLPFDSERRREFLGRWFGKEGTPDRERAAEVAGVLDADRGLRELASNPLYLTLLALLIQDGEKPERRRTKLYDQIFELLEEGRQRRPPTPIDNRAVAHQGLRWLAHQMTWANRDAETLRQLERRLLEDDELRGLLQAGWPSLRTYLLDVAEKTGILGPHDGADAPWRYWHRTFREALVAEALAERLGAQGPATGARPTTAEIGASEADWQPLLDEAQRVTDEDAGRWAEPYALLAGRVKQPDALVRALVEVNRPLGLRAVATAQGLREETLREILELTDQWEERQKVFERLPELIDDPIRVLALVDQLRQRTRNGNDLFFLEQAVTAVSEKWPAAGRAVAELQQRFYDHIPPPSEELFRSIDTPLDGRVELWCKIPAGKFLMGSPEDEEDRQNSEGSQHEVRIASPFWMAAVPVTIAQYAAFEPEHRSGSESRASKEALTFIPVDGVTWYQAVAFCRWLSASLPLAKGARLPTEEEWEYACRAGTRSRYWSGDEEADLEQVGWFRKNSGGCAHSVGQKPANPWGLYDMSGNVWEWTLSGWTEDYAKNENSNKYMPPGVASPAHTDVSGSATVVSRGGCFASRARSARAACRGPGTPGYGHWNQGFRICLPIRL